MALEALEGNRLEEPRRHDAVGVNVRTTQYDRSAGDLLDDRGPAHLRPRTSTTSPASAAAATIAGLISRVRPVGLPWRPLKFRLDEAARTSSPRRRSGFMARHIEQPAPRHSKPASVKIASSPSVSAAARTCCDPGTTSALT